MAIKVTADGRYEGSGWLPGQSVPTYLDESGWAFLTGRDQWVFMPFATAGGPSHAEWTASGSPVVGSPPDGVPGESTDHDNRRMDDLSPKSSPPGSSVGLPQSGGSAAPPQAMEEATTTRVAAETPRVVSPDGQWLWTGQEWVPAPPAAAAVAYERPDPLRIPLGEPRSSRTMVARAQIVLVRGWRELRCQKPVVQLAIWAAAAAVILVALLVAAIAFIAVKPLTCDGIAKDDFAIPGLTDQAYADLCDATGGDLSR